MPQQRRVQGFTIVELLIVIVVVAILAAISVVAFNGVQQRARNTSRIATAKTYVSAINQYTLVNRKVPGNPAFPGDPCLGRDTNNRCKGVDSVDVSNGNSASVDPQLDTDLKTILSNLPLATTQPIRTSNNYYIKAYVGPVLSGDTSRYVDGKQVGTALTYWLEGENQSCGMPVYQYVTYDSANSRNVYTATNTTGYTQSGWSITICVAPIQDLATT